MTFKVGDKVTSEAFGDGVVKKTKAAHIYEVIVFFDSGQRQSFTKDGFYYLDNNEPLKNIKHKEAQGMNKSDLKTGMVVEQRNGGLRVVLADVGLLVGQQWSELDGFKDDLKHDRHNEMDIMKIYAQPKIDKSDYANTSLTNRTLLWQREEVKEMTVPEISKALGYTVKVVGGE